MKIAILTWTYKNYGTQLQAYSLCEYLKKAGHEVVLIDYTTQKKDVIHYGKFNLKYQFSRLIKKVTQIKYEHRLAILPDEYRDALKERDDIFSRFMNENLPLTKKYYKKDLIEISDLYDLYIVGSDQIWSPKYLDGRFYLDFVSDNNKMGSYAPSFGVDDICEEIKPLIAKWIKRFKFLSVRETTGANIVRKLIGKDIKVVLDPTFLFKKEEWEKMLHLSYQLNYKYILCYFLGENDYYWNIVRQVHNKTGYKVVIIPNTPNDFEAQYEKAINVSPQEFVNYIRNASYVITDSFHGVAFSINFEVNFLALARFSEKSKDSENSRIKSILDLMGFSERFTSNDCISCEMMASKDAWDKVNIRKNKMRIESKKYIELMLGEVEHGNDNNNMFGM